MHSMLGTNEDSPGRSDAPAEVSTSKPTLETFDDKLLNVECTRICWFEICLFKLVF